MNAGVPLLPRNSAPSPGTGGGFLLEAKIVQLRTAVIIDYQNLHLIAARLFEPEKRLHESLIHPLNYANQFVYRGLPSPNHDAKLYARNQAQKSEWERNRRVKVTLRALKYDYQRTADGQREKDRQGASIYRTCHLGLAGHGP